MSCALVKRRKKKKVFRFRELLECVYVCITNTGSMEGNVSFPFSGTIQRRICLFVYYKHLSNSMKGGYFPFFWNKLYVHLHITKTASMESNVIFPFSGTACMSRPICKLQILEVYVSFPFYLNMQRITNTGRIKCICKLSVFLNFLHVHFCNQTSIWM